MSNLRQVDMLLTMYADSNNERLPTVSSGHWAWDVPRDVADSMVSGGTSPMIFFCKGCGFSREDFDAQWNEFVSSPPRSNDFRVVGYALTFPGTASVLSTNQNPSILPQSLLDTNSGVSYPAPPPSERVLAADATISQPHNADTVNRSGNVYVNIKGAYLKPHQTAHLNRTYPAGGNMAMLDGHVEWRQFENMYPRTDTTLPSPVFWW